MSRLRSQCRRVVRGVAERVEAGQCGDVSLGMGLACFIWKGWGIVAADAAGGTSGEVTRVRAMQQGA